MKTLLSLAGVLALFTHTARALTEVHQITSEKDCPVNLKIRVEPAQADHDLVVISVTLTPQAPEAYRGRVKAFSHLQVASRGRTVFDGELETTKDADGFRCRFRVHADSLNQSRLTLSSRLYELDGHPTLGGGEIYEISLRGFAPSVAGQPNVKRMQATPGSALGEFEAVRPDAPDPGG